MKTKLVKKITYQTMAGDSYLEKWINAYLTTQFIVKGNVPPDECLREAKEIMNKIKAHLNSDTIYVTKIT